MYVSIPFDTHRMAHCITAYEFYIHTSDTRVAGWKNLYMSVDVTILNRFCLHVLHRRRLMHTSSLYYLKAESDTYY